MTRERAHQLRRLIEKGAASLSDEEALDGVELFEAWQTDTDYAVGVRVRYGEKLYRCVQAHTSQHDWAPEKTPALWEEVAKQEQGTKDNPIIYDGNMALEQGKYYTQDGVLYLCTRDTVNPVYARLADLVGLYVELADT